MLELDRCSAERERQQQSQHADEHAHSHGADSLTPEGGGGTLCAMAGRPKRRAQRIASATAPTQLPAPSKTPSDAIPDAVPSRARAHAGAHHARTPVEPLRPRPLRSPMLGSATRAVADDAQAQTMLRLSQHIKPGVEIRIERARPSWAAGWLEDYPIEATGDALQELYEHLRDEHGGQLYKLTVLAPGETPLYVGAVPIAGQVRERGRPLSRDAWDPQPARAAVREREPNAPAPPLPIGEMLGAFGSFMQMVLGQQDKAAQLQIAAVRDMVASSQKQTSELTSAVLQVRSSESEHRGLAGQIAELMDGVTAVESLRKRFGAAAAAPDKEDESALDGALKDATRHFLGSVMGSMAQGRGGGRPRPPARPPRRMANVSHVAPTPAPVVGEQPQGIPDAIPGHLHAQN